MVSVEGEKYYPDLSESTLGSVFRKKLQDIRTGVVQDEHGWNTIIETKDELLQKAK